MKHQHESPETASAETLPDYDFSGMEGVRGKYYRKYRQGHTVRIHRQDGSTEVRHFKLEDGAVMLDPEVRTYFPDSDAVNRALRGLIELIPMKAPHVTDPIKT